VAVLLPALVVGVLMSAGPTQASASARSCGAALSVGSYEVRVAKSRVPCKKAQSVAGQAFKSFDARPELGGHGTFLGFRCVFVATTTLDFSEPDGPAVYCKSWNRFVVASAEPDDPPTSWSFTPLAMTSGEAALFGRKALTSRSSKWVKGRQKSAHCSTRLGTMARRCSFRWQSGNSSYIARLRIRTVPVRTWPDGYRVAGTVERRWGACANKPARHRTGCSRRGALRYSWPSVPIDS